MKPEEKSLTLFGVTRSKAKMYEYAVPETDHIKLTRNPTELLTLTIGILGEIAAQINSTNSNTDRPIELQTHLRFAARYFDSYRQSRLAVELGDYLLLVGAASYYLCDLPGSAKVLSDAFPSYEIDELNLEARGLERFLLWLLKDDFSSPLSSLEGIYGDLLGELSAEVVRYYQDGGSEGDLLSAATRLRRRAYEVGTARELLFADTIAALVRRRYEHSSWRCLPRFSGLPIAAWKPALRKPTFIREFWPAQRLLGERGVFTGESAVVQMPTSAGKSRAMEIIIRSAFLSGRALLAVVVAPFRALCHEIRDGLVSAFQQEPVTVDELSDVFQTDFDVEALLGMHGVLVVTPEKLVYVLRHAPELANRIGLLLYDEGHQFDTGTRGVTYELLITSLKTMITGTVQTVLISAVLPNAEAIGSWLNGENPNIASGADLNPTERTVAFASWQDSLGRLDFVEQDDPDKHQFFVPRVIESYELQRRSRENARIFPTKNDGRSVALYLGLRLVQNGSVAIFCGKKDAAIALCDQLVDAYNRGLPLAQPVEQSEPDEVRRIAYLCESNLGEDSPVAACARMGVFTHHGNTPHGIRQAVEHAMKFSLARFVICTSTLAQGVNLPIRYLIVTSVYQGRDRIRIRDFHNLIGRAGRSGIYTEGSILFADPELYDRRNLRSEMWRWREIKALLSPDQSEPCDSALLSIFSPLQSENRKQNLPLDPLDIPRTYVETAGETWIAEMAAKLSKKGFPQADLELQIARKVDILATIESFLMAHWDDVKTEDSEEGILLLVEGTLAYHLATAEDQDRLRELFRLLAGNINQKAPDSARRNVFARTLYGLDQALMIEEWVTEHIEEMCDAETAEELLELLWQILAAQIQNPTFRKCNPSTVLQQIAMEWIEGKSFADLYQTMERAGVRLGFGKKPRSPKVETAVEICENALGYDGALAVGAITELAELLRPDETSLAAKLQFLQKRIKYGLPSLGALGLYELGFSDRVIALSLSEIVGKDLPRQALLQELSQRELEVRSVLEDYPRHFGQVLDSLLG